MRVLVATTPGWGHIAPVLPLAEALRRRGHQLVWLTAADGAARVAERGFDVRPAGLTLAERLPRARGVLSERAGSVPPDQRRALAFSTHFALLAAPAAIDTLRAVVAEWRPDILLREPAELAAAVVALETELPVATVGFGALVPPAAHRRAVEVLDPLLGGAGVVADTERFRFGDLYLHPMPASMETEPVPSLARRFRLPRPVPSGPTAPSIVADLGRDRPAVYATFGTEFGPMAPWRPVVEALGELDVDALVTTGAGGLPDDVEVPSRVRIATYVDQGDVLDRVAVVVSHAGSGTVLGAAATGTPQVCLPLGADQFENATAVAARGIGVRIDPVECDRDTVRGALQRVLDDPSFASSAGEVATELADTPDASEAASWIEDLLGHR